MRGVIRCRRRSDEIDPQRRRRSSRSTTGRPLALPGTGPNGENTPPRMSDQNRGLSTQPCGGVFDTSTNPIVSVSVSLYFDSAKATRR